jgi:IclR family transcriptional regulator, KDG regulon repressor
MNDLLERPRSRVGRPRTAGADSERGTNKATVRILSVLAAFATDTPSFGVTELSNRLGMSKNMVFRALSTLVDQGYLVRSAAAGRYELGFGVLELCNPRERTPDLRTLAKPFVARMHAISGETVSLSVRVGDTIVVIGGIEPDAPFIARVRVGLTHPLHASPGARIVLAQLSDEQVRQYIERRSPLVKLTETTLVEPEAVLADVQGSRKDGYALGLGDATANIVSVAFPILDAERKPWGSMTVGGPKERFGPQRLRDLLPQLQQVADELNHRTRLYHYEAPPSFFQ